MSAMIKLYAVAALFPLSLFFTIWFALSLYGRRLRAKNEEKRMSILKALGHSSEGNKLIGFFHPYCNAGGGGERVLWTAIANIQRSYPEYISIIYSGDVDVTKTFILEKVKARFDISLNPSLCHFVFLQSRKLVEDSAWPHFTLLGQSLGSMYLAWEAMSALVPDLYIDTMGYAFTFHVVKLLGKIPVGAYVHYPTINTDMLARVKSRKRWHTNADIISSSSSLSYAKLLYYRVFMYYYSMSLRSASFLMVNSSWTKNHVDSILQHTDTTLDLIHLLPPFLAISLLRSHNGPKSAHRVYPPCDTRELAQFALKSRERIILSIAQFRPEKDHAMQLHAFQILLHAHPEYTNRNELGVRLVLIGGSRNVEDSARVKALRKLAHDLHIEQYVTFIENAPYSVMLNWLSRSSIGLSTMVDEHFGINIVEFMAAGAIPVVHASGGPFQDIVVSHNGERTGYHATTPEEFASAFETILALSSQEELSLRQKARTWAVKSFSEEEFEKNWNTSGWRTWLYR